MTDRCDEMLAVSVRQCTRVEEVPGCGRPRAENPEFCGCFATSGGADGRCHHNREHHHEVNFTGIWQIDLPPSALPDRLSLVTVSGYSAAWLARLTGGQEVMGSNPVSPIFLQIEPFGEKVERLSLCGDQSYVAHLPVQTDRIQNLAPNGSV